MANQNKRARMKESNVKRNVVQLNVIDATKKCVMCRPTTVAIGPRNDRSVAFCPWSQESLPQAGRGAQNCQVHSAMHCMTVVSMIHTVLFALSLPTKNTPVKQQSLGTRQLLSDPRYKVDCYSVALRSHT